MKNWGTYLIIGMLFFASCEKDEIPVVPHPPGEVNAKEIIMGPLYPDQIWYNMESGTEVSRNYKALWDIGFECNNDAWHVVLNTAGRMQVAATNDTSLIAVTDTFGLNFSWDSHTGNLDSTGIGDWRITPQVYVLDLGHDEKGKSLGLGKVAFDSVTETTFYFRYANFNDTEWKSTSIDKDTNYVYSYFSYKTEEQVWTAPPKHEWDICFTQYTYIYYYMNPIVAYLVTGVTLNPTNTFSATDFDKPFADISMDDIPTYDFNNRIDNIGWSWKKWDFDAGYYVTFPKQNYIFRAQSGKMYKIHFLDWYNADGQKGTASFEFSEL